VPLGEVGLALRDTDHGQSALVGLVGAVAPKEVWNSPERVLHLSAVDVIPPWTARARRLARSRSHPRRQGLARRYRRSSAQALPLAEAEEGTVNCYAAPTSPTTFWIFDTFGTEDARQAHINGEIAAALMANADELLAAPPEILAADVLATK
jgi:quinol monooxygenase YgiN